MNSSKNSSKNLIDIALFTKEEYPIDEILSCHSILKDKAFLLKNNMVPFDDTTWRSVKRRLSVLDHILSTDQPTPTDNQTFTRTIPYGYLKNNKLGRLYPKVPSISSLPRDLRYFLFNGTGYIDIDLQNAHPAILYEFASEKNISTPLLKQLVLNRTDFQNTVAHELHIADEQSQKKQVKKYILIAFYTPGNEYKTKSLTLRHLNKELEIIRASVTDHFKTCNHPIEFERAVTAQSYYCMTKESEYLVRLYNYINERLGTDPSHLHFIPIFDGALVKHDLYNEGLKLRDLVKDFNETLEHSRFLEKPFNEEPDGFVSKKEFAVHLAVRRKINKLKAADMPKLYAAVGIPDFRLPESLVCEIMQSEKNRSASIAQLKSQRKLEKDPVGKAAFDKKIDDITPLYRLEKKLETKIRFECDYHQGWLRELLFDLEEAGRLDDTIEKALVSECD